MDNQYNFDDIARLPAPSDNVAIATRRLEANSEIRCDGEQFELSHYHSGGASVCYQAHSGGGTAAFLGVAVRFRNLADSTG